MKSLAELLKERTLEKSKTETTAFRELCNLSLNDFKEIIRLNAEIIQVATNKRLGYEFDEYSLPMVEYIHKWLTGERNGEINPFRGIWIAGKYGTGKTLLLKSLCEMLTDIALTKNSYIPKFYKSFDLIKQYQEGNYSVNPKNKGILIIDELGREPVVLNEYGNKRAPIVEILEQRYDFGLITIVISNYTIEDTRTIYGEFVIERFKEMFNYVNYKGGSRRK